MPPDVRNEVPETTSMEQPTHDIYSNPYKAKRPWPPDVNQLSAKHQFRFERKYKRRLALKWARPRWMVATKMAQYIGCFGVLIWGVLLMPGSEARSEGFQNWYRRATDFVMMRKSQPSTQSNISEREKER